MKKAVSLGLIAVFTASALNAESLWLSKNNRQRGIFADRVASDIGDIITIQVDESTTVSASMSKQSSSSANGNVGTTESFFGLNLGSGGVFGPGTVGYDMQGPGNQGSGSITNVQSVSSSATVMVVDKLPNGNLIIEGARQQVVSGETQYVIIRGIVRPEDISGDNSVMSSKIGNAQVEFLDKGAIAAAQKEGWITKLLNAANIW